MASMKTLTTRFIGMVLVATAGVLAANAGSIIGQSQAVPPDRPNLNGIWQALNEANFDLEPHPARAAMSLRQDQPYPVTTNIPSPQVVALGAVGSVPGGLRSEERRVGKECRL